MKKTLSIFSVILIFGCLLYGLIIIREQSKTIKEHERLISELQTELEYQNKVDYSLRNSSADVQAQLDWNELYIWQYGTGQLSKAEFAARIENNPGRSKNLLEIKIHNLPWDKQLKD